jgi:thiol-disulfide isomerase/thioredoxin
MESQVIAVVKPGCPACEESKPGIQRAKKQVTQKKVRFQEVNYDQHPEIAEQLNVQQFPELVYTNRNGHMHTMPWNGIPTAKDIVNWIDTIAHKPTSLIPSLKPALKPALKPKQKTCEQCGPNGIDKKIWGPPLWYVIHMTALMYPRKPTLRDRKKMKQFLTGLSDVLPCSYCQKHYTKELQQLPEGVFDSRDTLFEWTVTFHDSVSDRTHNPQPRRSVEYWKFYYKQQAMKAIKLRKKNVQKRKNNNGNNNSGGNLLN